MKTFIFGAGASVPFFSPRLSTKYLTDKVCNRDEWERVIKKYKYLKGDNICIANVDTIMAVIDTVKLIKEDAHFEQIAEIIDKISSYGFDGVPVHNMQSLTIAVMNSGFRPQSGRPFGPEWTDVPFLFREIIVEAILDLQNNHKGESYDELLMLQQQMIHRVCQADENVSVMSLNYDDCVIDSLFGLGFEKGFSLVDERYLRQIDIKKFMEAKKVVYFPHGQLKFQFTDNDNVTFWGDSNLANDERWEGLRSATVGSTLTVLNGKYAYNYNTFISTGQTKDDGLNHLPYAIYYQRLAIDLAKSDTIYVIGYSFGDEHINRLLRSFLKLSEDNKIVIVDYYTDQVLNTHEHRDPNNIITKIYQYLGADWKVAVSEATDLVPFNPTEVERINELGYGELCSQVIFYKKGYADFLREFDDVLNL